MAKTRGLTKRFQDDLRDDGILHSLLRRVKKDTSLDLEIRANYLNVYYRGGSLLKVASAPRGTGAYSFVFNTDYDTSRNGLSGRLPCATVNDAAGTKDWLAAIPLIKNTMDLWFGRHPKDERALQQMVVWENNDSPWANGTDWFDLDIEYDNHDGARFDLVGLRWDSTASARKLTNAYRPRLAIIEMKAGDGALAGKAGIEAHLKQLRGFVSDRRRVQRFRREMLTVFRQKRQFGLIKALRSNSNAVDILDADIDLIFLLAGHDPASRKLGTILRTMNGSDMAAVAGAEVCLCAANFTGFGLYGENVLSLPRFLERYALQIGA